VLDPGPGARPVLAHRCDADGATVVALHNVADAAVSTAPLLQGVTGVELTDVLNPRADPVPVAGDGRLEVTLPRPGQAQDRPAEPGDGVDVPSDSEAGVGGIHVRFVPLLSRSSVRVVAHVAQPCLVV
jgi:hypothetical protein